MSEWKPVVGYEGIYEVRQGTDGGRVRRVKALKRTYVGRELGGTDSLGYARVVLSKPGLKPKHVRIHTLVLEAFVGPAPAGCEACHKDDNPKNNTIPNLYWGGRGDNVKDAYRNGLRVAVVKSGQEHHNSKLSDEQRAEMRNERLKGRSLGEIAKDYGVSAQTVFRVCRTPIK